MALEILLASVLAAAITGFVMWRMLLMRRIYTRIMGTVLSVALVFLAGAYVPVYLRPASVTFAPVESVNLKTHTSHISNAPPQTSYGRECIDQAKEDARKQGVNAEAYVSSNQDAIVRCEDQLHATQPQQEQPQSKP
jgi:hypothetical protein